MTKKLVHVALIYIVLLFQGTFHLEKKISSLAGQFINKTYQIDIFYSLNFFKIQQINNFESDYLLRVWSTIPSK